MGFSTDSARDAPAAHAAAALEDAAVDAEGEEDEHATAVAEVSLARFLPPVSDAAVLADRRAAVQSAVGQAIAR